MMLSKRRQQKKREKVRNHVIGQKEFQEKTNVFEELRKKSKKVI